MQLGDFEALVTASEESQSLDFKGPCNWNVRELVKDFLAMANVQDGGYLVFGFNDGTFERVGLTDNQIASFDQEIMQDQIAEFADPHVDFRVYNNIVDADGKKFVVVRIFEFTEVPVVCKRDSNDVAKGRMYYRTKTRRPSSEQVSNAYELRDILDRSTAKIMAIRRAQGYAPAEEPDAGRVRLYEEELGGL